MKESGASLVTLPAGPLCGSGAGEGVGVGLGAGAGGLGEGGRGGRGGGAMQAAIVRRRASPSVFTADGA